MYTTVLVPPTVTLRSTTLTLLERFAAAGGRVVFAGVPADHVDAQPSDRAAALAARATRAPASGAELIQAIEPARRVSIADAAGNEVNAALYLLTEDADAFVLFVCNTGLEGAERLRDIFDEPRVVERRAAYPLVIVRLLEKTAGRPVELDPDTGATWNTEAAQDAEGRWTVSTSLPVLGSRLFVFPKERQPKAPPRRPRLLDGQRVELDGERWEVLLSEDNVLPLDRPRLRLGDGEWQEPEEVLRVDRKVRAALASPASGRRDGAAMVPARLTETENHPGGALLPVRDRHRAHGRRAPVPGAAPALGDLRERASPLRRTSSAGGGSTRRCAGSRSIPRCSARA